MNRTLTIKELRETWWMAAICLIAVIGILLTDMGLRVFEREGILLWETPRFVPFLSGDAMQALVPAFVLAIVLGLWQTVGESVQGTWVFLLHRPVSRAHVIFSKLATGLILIFVSVAVPVLCYCCWAATDGTRPAPFEWWMTEEFWRGFALVTLIYLTTFLIGIDTSRIYGTRFWPALLFFGVAVYAFDRPGFVPASEGIALVASHLIVGLCLLHTALSRDYA